METIVAAFDLLRRALATTLRKKPRRSVVARHEPHQKDAEGFIRLNGLRLRTNAKRDAR